MLTYDTNGSDLFQLAAICQHVICCINKYNEKVGWTEVGIVEKLDEHKPASEVSERDKNEGASSEWMTPLEILIATMTAIRCICCVKKHNNQQCWHPLLTFFPRSVLLNQKHQNFIENSQSKASEFFENFVSKSKGAGFPRHFWSALGKVSSKVGYTKSFFGHRKHVVLTDAT